MNYRSLSYIFSEGKILSRNFLGRKVEITSWFYNISRYKFITIAYIIISKKVIEWTFELGLKKKDIYILQK